MDVYADLLEGIARSNLTKIQMILNQSNNIEEILKKEDPSKQTPLFHACLHNNDDFAEKVTELFLNRGADPHHADLNGQTIMSYLAREGKFKILTMLIDRYNFDLNKSDLIKQTPIFWAAAKNYKNCVELFLKNGADINYVDNNGQTPIFYAAFAGHLDMCKFLVNHNANFLHIDKNKQTPQNYARKGKHPAVIDYFSYLKNHQKAKQKQAQNRLESSQQQSKTPLKKKEMLRNQYFLVYTNEKGQVHELTPDQILQFSNFNSQNGQIMQLLKNEQKIDSLPNPQQKKFEKVANKILTYFMKHQQGLLFLEPVDYISLNIPNYPQIVKKPMDFTTIKVKLNFNCYGSEEEFLDDMNLVFDNCLLFNGRENLYGKIALQLKLELMNMYKKEFQLI